MPLAGTEAITELWAKCKAWYGRKLGASTTATTASVQLKNNAGDNLGDAATIGAATSTSAGVMTADMYNKLDGIEAGAQANDVTGVKGSSESSYRTGNVSLTAANVGAAASGHAHGNITNGGDITAAAPTVASGDKLVINDESASKITNGPAFGTSKTTFLRNDGTWGTPAGTTYSDFTGATASAAGTHGLVPAPAATNRYDVLTNEGWVSFGGALFNYLDQVMQDPASGYLLVEGDDFGTDNSGTLMTSSERTKLAGIATGATANSATTTTPKMDGTAAVGSETAYAKGDHVHPTDTSRAPVKHDSSADTYGKGTSSNYGHVKLSDSTSATTAAASGGTAATPKAVKDALDAAKSYADGLATGAAMFKGTLGPSGATYTEAQLEASSYKAGWYWVVKTAGTYVGQSCEAGDMVFATSNKSGSTYSSSDFSVVQNNVVEMTAAEVDAICV